jgi:hypothetical protein
MTAEIVNTPEWETKPDDCPIHDEAFWVKKQRFGTYLSVARDGTRLVTSLHEQLCVDATRSYLKFKQEN